MTCSREINDKIVKINDNKSKSTPRPIISLKLGSGYSRGWLFDTGAAITCMAIKELRRIPSYVKLQKIANSGRICQGASGANLIPVGTFLMPLEWQGKKILHPVIVFNNLNTPLIMGIDAIHHMSITYLSMSESFLFQEDIIGENKFRKADLMTVATTFIPARTSVPVRLGTAIGRRHTPMAAGIQSVTTVGNPDFPAPSRGGLEG